MAPEYAMHGQFSVKTDVFSFGVLVIEIITGKRNNNGRGSDDDDAEDLLSWVSTHKFSRKTCFYYFGAASRFWGFYGNSFCGLTENLILRCWQKNYFNNIGKETRFHDSCGKIPFLWFW